jgi:hypothetical protein
MALALAPRQIQPVQQPRPKPAPLNPSPTDTTPTRAAPGTLAPPQPRPVPQTGGGGLMGGGLTAPNYTPGQYPQTPQASPPPPRVPQQPEQAGVTTLGGTSMPVLYGGGQAPSPAAAPRPKAAWLPPHQKETPYGTGVEGVSTGTPFAMPVLKVAENGGGDAPVSTAPTMLAPPPQVAPPAVTATMPGGALPVPQSTVGVPGLEQATPPTLMAPGVGSAPNIAPSAPGTEQPPVWSPRETMAAQFINSLQRGSAPTIPGAGMTDFGPDNDLRATQINPSFDPRYEDRVAREIEAARIDPYGPLAGTDLSGARAMAGRAAGELDGARVRDRGPLAGTDLSGARGYLGRAEQDFAGASLPEFAGIGPADQSAAERLLGGSEALVNGSTLNTGRFAASGDADSARSQMMAALSGVTGGPDRAKLAADNFALMQERAQPVYDQRVRALGKNAAALGRLGAGMTTNDLTGLEQSYNREMTQAQRQMALDAAGMTMQDNLSRFGAASGAAGQLRGEDMAGSEFDFGVDQARANNGLNRAGMLGTLADQRTSMSRLARQDAVDERAFGASQADKRASLGMAKGAAMQGLGEQAARFGQIDRADRESDRAYGTALDTTNAGLALNRSDAMRSLADQSAGFGRFQRQDAEADRAYSTGVGQANAGLALQRAGAYGSLDSERAAREAGMRDEMRGERGHQSGQGQQNFENEMARTSLSDYLAQTQFGRDKSVLDTLLGVGFGGSPSNTLLAASQGAAPSAQSGSNLSDLAALWAYRQRQGEQPPPGNVPAFPTNWATG